ncbi:MAG: TetR/AcrR family transcriptional regulator [Spirochaetales bacterium]|jgi:AcrR family transcriptional regulator|nr:TetR/AcrR family transcriptional regulator [Spirochaetales bacterium]
MVKFCYSKKEGVTYMDMKAYIIAKGGELFKEKGYEAVTVNDICTACDITKTTFYYHLSSKQDILLQLYDVIVDNLTPMLRQMIHLDSSWEQIKLLFEHLITAFIALGPDLNSQLLIVNLQRKERALDVRTNLQEIAVDLIAQGQKRGQIRNTNDPASLYAAAAYMFTGYEYMWCTLRGEFAWKDLFFASLESLLDIEPKLRSH